MVGDNDESGDSLTCLLVVCVCKAWVIGMNLEWFVHGLVVYGGLS